MTPSGLQRCPCQVTCGSKAKCWLKIVGFASPPQKRQNRWFSKRISIRPSAAKRLPGPFGDQNANRVPAGVHAQPPCIVENQPAVAIPEERGCFGAEIDDALRVDALCSGRREGGSEVARVCRRVDDRPHRRAKLDARRISQLLVAAQLGGRRCALRQSSWQASLARWGETGPAWLPGAPNRSPAGARTKR